MTTQSRPTRSVVKACGLCVLAVLLLNLGGVLGAMIVVAATAGAATAVCGAAPQRWRAEQDRASGY